MEETYKNETSWVVHLQANELFTLLVQTQANNVDNPLIYTWPTINPTALVPTSSRSDSNPVLKSV